jgi:hypothetical protein
MTTQTAAPTPEDSILERVHCINVVDYMREISRTPSWARWIDESAGSFVRLRPEMWDKISAQAFFDAADDIGREK